MRKSTNVKTRKTVEKISKAILMLILISTIMAFCMNGYEKSAVAPNLIKSNENSTVDSSTVQNNASGAANGATSGGQPVAIDQSQLQSLDDYIYNNQQSPDSETPKEEKIIEEDGIQPAEENQEMNEQNAEENASEETISNDTDTNADNGIAIYASESLGDLNVSWKSQIKGEYWNKINKIIGTSDGGAVAVGWVYQESTNPTITTNGNKDALIIKYDSKGKIEWFKNYGGSGDDEFIDIEQASDGSFAGVGNTDSTDGNIGIASSIKTESRFLFGIDKNGNLVQSDIKLGSQIATHTMTLYGNTVYVFDGDTESVTHGLLESYKFSAGIFSEKLSNSAKETGMSVCGEGINNSQIVSQGSKRSSNRKLYWSNKL